MITPPRSISASPRLTRSVPVFRASSAVSHDPSLRAVRRYYVIDIGADVGARAIIVGPVSSLIGAPEASVNVVIASGVAFDHVRLHLLAAGRGRWPRPRPRPRPPRPGASTSRCSRPCGSRPSG